MNHLVGAVAVEVVVLRPAPAARQDVLVYTTAELTEDVEIIGPITARLYAATSARDRAGAGEQGRGSDGKTGDARLDEIVSTLRRRKRKMSRSRSSSGETASSMWLR